MNKIKPFSKAEYNLTIRRDKKRSRPRMTKGYILTFNPSKNHNNADRTGDWVSWWREGCGVLLDGSPSCPPGHAYYVERYNRAEHRKIKIAGRRKNRRKNKQIESDE